MKTVKNILVIGGIVVTLSTYAQDKAKRTIKQEQIQGKEIILEKHVIKAKSSAAPQKERSISSDESANDEGAKPTIKREAIEPKKNETPK